MNKKISIIFIISIFIISLLSINVLSSTNEVYFFEDFTEPANFCSDYDNFNALIEPDTCSVNDGELYIYNKGLLLSYFEIENPMSYYERTQLNWTWSIRFKPYSIYKYPTIFGFLNENNNNILNLNYMTNGYLYYPGDYLEFTNVAVGTGFNIYGYNISENLNKYVLIDLVYIHTNSNFGNNFIYMYVNGNYIGNVKESGVSYTSDLDKFGFDANLDSQNIGINMSIDYIKFWEGVHINETIPISPTFYCPLENCLFYDKFSYKDNSSLDGELLYYGTPDQTFINDGVLYLDSNITTTTTVYHDFMEDIYDKKEAIIKLNINASDPTPSLLETNPITYTIITSCDNDQIVNYLNVLITYDETYQGFGNQSALMQLYTYDENGLEVLGTYEIINGDDVYIRLEFDDNLQQTWLSANYESDVSLGYVAENYVIMDYRNYCTKFKGFDITRRDYNNPLNRVYVGFDSISYYGIYESSPFSDEFDDLNFIYTNKTTQNESYIKTDVGEEINNMLFNFGLKTPSSRLFAWTIILIMLIYSLIRVQGLESNAKTWIVVIVSVFWIVIGKYWELIPSEVFIFVLAIIGIIGAFAITRLISSGSEG